jgi:hypothetical protein
MLKLLAYFPLATVTTGENLYSLDSTWSPAFPAGAHTFSAVGVYRDQLFVTQRGNSTLPPVLRLSTQNGDYLQGWGDRDIALAQPGNTWGAHGLSIESCNYPCVENDAFPSLRVWIEDFTNHTVTSFSSSGKKILQIGTPGVAGNGSLQFDHVADAFVSPGVAAPSPGPEVLRAPSFVYATDGDGGYANRVMKIQVPNTNTARGDGPFEVWVTGHVFNNPHSITLHAASQFLIVADREQQSLQLLSSETGTVLGELDCGLKFGQGFGVPFGVRTMVHDGRDMLFVASMDNPQDHMYQKITVLDISKLTLEDGAMSKCSVIQTIHIDPNEYSGPHLLGVDESTGDVYAALVADTPLGTVLRFRLDGSQER